MRPRFLLAVRRWLVALITLTVLAGACDSTPVLEPEVVERVESCGDLVPIGAELVRRLADAVEGASLEMVTGEIPPTDELAALQRIGVELDQRAARLACDPVELNAAINEDTAGVKSDDPVAQILLDIVREGVVDTLPPTATTTSTPAGS